MALEQLLHGEDCAETDALLLNLLETYAMWHAVLKSKMKPSEDVKVTRVVSGEG